MLQLQLNKIPKVLYPQPLQKPNYVIALDKLYQEQDKQERKKSLQKPVKVEPIELQRIKQTIEIKRSKTIESQAPLPYDKLAKMVQIEEESKERYKKIYQSIREKLSRRNTVEVDVIDIPKPKKRKPQTFRKVNKSVPNIPFLELRETQQHYQLLKRVAKRTSKILNTSVPVLSSKRVQECQKNILERKYFNYIDYMLYRYLSQFPLVQESLPFELFTSQTLEDLEKDQELRTKLNSKINRLEHESKYVWVGQGTDLWNQEHELKILALTWNMQGNMPKQSLKRLLQVGLVHHDLIIFGTQECQRSIGVSLFCASKEDWEEKLQTDLGILYKKINSVSLNAMHLVVFAHVKLIPNIKYLNQFSLSQGFMNIVGNKGGVALLFSINDIKFLVVNSHLESGQTAQQVRMKQFNELNNYFSEKQADVVIWTGDFNSRVNLNIQENQQNIDYYEWIKQDQFYLSRQSIQNFQYQEGMIYFPPTYKLQVIQNQWNRDFRIPGWTDRIIFKENNDQKQKSLKIEPLTNQTNRLKLHNYDCSYDTFGSDHRPVYAQFTVNI
ncbi:hypothetical protein pb186bvf_003104 [Paramecium bursaria]